VIKEQSHVLLTVLYRWRRGQRSHASRAVWRSSARWAMMGTC